MIIAFAIVGMFSVAGLSILGLIVCIDAIDRIAIVNRHRSESSAPWGI